MQSRHMLMSVLVPCLVCFAACSGQDGANGRNGADGTNGMDGDDGQNSVIRTTAVAAGAECPNGGSLLEFGLDENANGLLDDDEVDGQATVCSGADGQNGMDGTNGTDGTNGMDGQDGGTSLIAVTDEPAGNTCPTGGKRIDTGVDDDGNGTLEPAEVDNSTTICNGADGQDGQNGMDGTNGTDGTDGQDGQNGLVSLVSVTPEPAGNTCSTGGQRIDTGIDDNSNGVLDAAEIDNTAYVCNGQVCSPRTITMTASDHVGFRGAQKYTDNRFRAYTGTSGDDIVTWARFDVPANVLNANVIVQSLTLTLTHEARFNSPFSSPSMELVYSAHDGWSRGSVTNTQLQVDKVVSGSYTMFPTTATPVDFAVDVSAHDWGAEFNTPQISLGVRENTPDYRYVYFFGSDAQATAPVLTAQVLTCP